MKMYPLGEHFVGPYPKKFPFGYITPKSPLLKRNALDRGHENGIASSHGAPTEPKISVSLAPSAPLIPFLRAYGHRRLTADQGASKRAPGTSRAQLIGDRCH